MAMRPGPRRTAKPPPSRVAASPSPSAARPKVLEDLSPSSAYRLDKVPVGNIKFATARAGLWTVETDRCRSASCLNSLAATVGGLALLLQVIVLIVN